MNRPYLISIFEAEGQLSGWLEVLDVQDAALALLLEHRLHFHADLYLVEVDSTNHMDNAGIGSSNLITP